MNSSASEPTAVTRQIRTATREQHGSCRRYVRVPIDPCGSCEGVHASATGVSGRGGGSHHSRVVLHRTHRLPARGHVWPRHLANDGEIAAVVSLVRSVSLSPQSSYHRVMKLSPSRCVRCVMLGKSDIQ